MQQSSGQYTAGLLSQEIYDVIDVSKHFLVNLQALSDCLYLIKNVNLVNV